MYDLTDDSTHDPASDPSNNARSNPISNLTSNPKSNPTSNITSNPTSDRSLAFVLLRVRSFLAHQRPVFEPPTLSVSAVVGG